MKLMDRQTFVRPTIRGHCDYLGGVKVMPFISGINKADKLYKFWMNQSPDIIKNKLAPTFIEHPRNLISIDNFREMISQGRSEARPHTTYIFF
ncbi:hypothetical protein BpHYR1_044438 [Brachionus plicatilis]|uniref:Uncharacterized protein n=1 Tax=Brachionus plicatilis TaxID=10195 RepID=A0A3M7Q0K0_BRAPC|nr:hypothetical protein BpHYR1_044438 [Brachionus plicatilis]